MPRVTDKPSGSPIWIELSSTDADASARFYDTLLGTATTDPNPEYGGYRNVLHDGEMVAGIMAAQGGAPSQWTVYLSTSDVDAALALAESNGGTIVSPAMDVMEMGRMGFVRDPSGATVGLWQPGTMAGTAIEDEAGAPCWYELHTTTAYDETIAFYERVFGWSTSVLGDSDEFRMVTFGEGDDSLAGIYDASTEAEGTPSAWRVYFAVGDADAAATAVVESGGTLTTEPDDTPYGRMFHAVDSTGAAFSIMRLPEG